MFNNVTKVIIMHSVMFNNVTLVHNVKFKYLMLSK